MQRLKVTRTRFILLFLIALAMGKSNVLAGNTLEQGSKSDSTIIEYLKEYGIHTTNNKEIKILKSGHEKFIDLFKEINKAQHHIHLEYFNFRNDSIANALFELLAKKAEEGVEVRALFDSFGNSSNNFLISSRKWIFLNKLCQQECKSCALEKSVFPHP